jgi:hypothetical protein
MKTADGLVDFTVSCAGGLDTGTVAANSWYAIFIIAQTGGTTSYVAHLMVAATTPVPTLPSGYTFYRYIGAVKTNGSSNLIAFHQYGQYFIWSQPVIDFSTGINSITFNVQTNLTLSIPLGQVVYPSFNTTFSLGSSSTSNGPSMFIGNSTNILPGGFPGNGLIHWTYKDAYSYLHCDFLQSNTSGQIMYFISGPAPGASWTVLTMGWIDPHVASVW